jgi:hypothetical protein
MIWFHQRELEDRFEGLGVLVVAVVRLPLHDSDERLRQNGKRRRIGQTITLTVTEHD